MSTQLALFADAITDERANEAKAYAKANPSWRGGIIAKLQHYSARDLSDAEIERCLKGCVGVTKLTFVAKGLRDAGIIKTGDLSAPSC